MNGVPPTHGSSFLSMQCNGGPDNMGEGISLVLCEGVSLQAGQQYCFAIDLITRNGGFAANSRLRIYGSMSTCQMTQLLYDSPSLTGNWQTYNFCFTPTANWTVISFRVVNPSSGFSVLGLDNWVSTDGLFPPGDPVDPVTDFTYPTPLCTTGNDASPTPVPGFTTGGNWTSSAGLAINTNTGLIDVSASTPGTYTVTYLVPDGTCANEGSSTFQVVIEGPPTATIDYNDPFCAQATSGAVTLTGTTGGTYTASPAGISINASTGSINPSASTPGTYTVTYTAPAVPPCAAAVATTQVVITDQPDATIAYNNGPFCTTQNNIPVALTGTGGGSYTASPAGLSIDAGTGAVNGSASTAGTYTVTYSIPAQPPCAAVTATTQIILQAPPAATITYAGNPFCAQATNGPVTLTGTAGGTYTASPAGLAINASTGAIDPSASTPGTYTVSYTTPAAGACPAVVTTTQVEVTQQPAATIAYNGGPFCSTQANIPVTLTGTSGGTYTASPAGLSIDASTGMVNGPASTAGTYTVTYSIPAQPPCTAVNATTQLTINTGPSATIAYAGTPFCTSSTNGTVTITGTTGGAFTGTAGLSINTTTGAIDPSISTPGLHTVTYTLDAPAPCPDLVVTTEVTIHAEPNASISYAPGTFCTTTLSVNVVFQGTTGGNYSAPAGLTINSSTGAVTPSTSTPGTYIVTYTSPATAPCTPAVATTEITIVGAPSATITYSGPFCTSGAPVNVTLTGTTGGTFSSSAGLSLNANTGAVDPGSSTPGTYTVTYGITAQAPCSNVNVTTSITINEEPTATISYPGGPFCSTQVNITVTQTGTTGGTYTAGAGLAINPATGSVNPSSSQAGDYTVSYTTPASPPCVPITVTATITIVGSPTAAIDYPGGPFCISDAPVSVVVTGATGGVFSSSGGLAVDPTTGLVVPDASTPGSYTVTYTVQAPAPCPALVVTDVITIQAPGNPEVAFIYPSPLCNRGYMMPGRPSDFVGGGIFASVPQLPMDPTSGLINLAAAMPGVYNVTYAVGAGDCMLPGEHLQTIVIEDCVGSVYIPNAFTPNGDEINDLFGLVGMGIESMRLDVFNRWGELIFTSERQETGWDGSYNGTMVPDGVYTYKARVKFHPGYEPVGWPGVVYGHVTVLR